MGFAFGISEKLKNIKEKIAAKASSDPMRFLFYTVCLVCVTLVTILRLLTRGCTLDAVLFSDRKYFFTDYFDSVFYSLNGPYQNYNVIYPALITLVYEGIGIILEYFSGEFQNSFEIRDSVPGYASYVISVIIGLIILYAIISKSSKLSKTATYLSFAVFATSYPMLYCLDRGNSMLFSVLFIALFVMLYDSENKKHRYLSYIFLGLATATKIYPILFGTLVLKRTLEEKNYPELIGCIAICSALLFLPFPLTDGSFMDMFHNAFGYSSSTEAYYGRVNIVALITGTAEMLEAENFSHYTLLSAISYAFMIVVLIAALLDRKAPAWQTVCLLAGTQVLCAGLGTEYLLLYMIIPAWYFINSEIENTRKNMIYCLLFIGILISIPGSKGLGNTFTFVKGILTLIITILILSESYSRLKEEYGNKKESGAEYAA